MAVDIGPKIGIDGEAEFRKALKDINQQLKTLGSEMNAVTSAFTDETSAQEKARATADSLSKQITVQEDKIRLLKEGLAASAEKYGENDAATLKWRQAVADATTTLNGMKSKLTDAEKGISDTGDAANETANATQKVDKSLKDAADSADKAGNKFSGFASVLKGVGAAIASVAAAAAAAAVKLGKEVVAQAAELEQNLGGSEAVFGEYAKNIQDAGVEAYKNLGLSQSDYLAKANVMGALFQGSAVSQERSMELVESAMQRAADMASVMGLDVKFALDSVTGAAKGNYTMMDNLGVAMNETTLESYGLEKALERINEEFSTRGIDMMVESADDLDAAWDALQESGTSVDHILELFDGLKQNQKTGAWSFDTAILDSATKAELAMQMFLERTEQYAGNFERESTETISGAIGLLQGAIGSLVAGLGTANADLQQLVQNAADAASKVIENVVPVIENLVEALPTVVGAIADALMEMLPTLLDTATTLFDSVLQMLISLLPDLIPVALDAVMTIVETVIENLPELISAGLKIILSLVSGLTEALPKLLPAATAAIMEITDGLIDNLPAILDAALALILALAEGLVKSLPEIIKRLPEIITGILNFLITSYPLVMKAGVDLLKMLVENMPEILGNIGGAIAKIIDTILQKLKGAWESMKDAGLDLIKGLWEGILAAKDWLWDKITGFASSVVDGFKDAFGIHSPSRLFRDEIGAQLAAGVGLGFTDEMRSVAAQMQKSIPTPEIAFNNAAAGMVNGMSTAVAGIGTATPTTIILQTADGQALARWLLPDLRAVSRANPEVAMA